MRGCEPAVCRVCAGARHLQTPHSTSVPFAPEPQLSRRKPVRQIPIIAAILVAAVLAPVAASADRMWIGFHDDPVLRYDAEKATRHGGCHQDEQGDDPANPRHLGQHRADEAGQRDGLRRPRVQLQRPRRLRPQRAGAGRRGPDDDLGNAEVGQRRQDAQLPPDVDEQLPELHQGARLTVLRPHPRPAVRAVLRDLERVEPRPVPVTAVQLERQDREPRGLREARGSRLRRHQGGQPQGARRDRRDLLERPQQAARRARATRFGRARSPRASPRRTRTSSSTRGRITRIPCR